MVRLASRRNRRLLAALALVVVAIAVAVVVATGSMPGGVEPAGRAGVRPAQALSFFGASATDRRSTPADNSGASVYDRGRFSPLGAVPGAAAAGHVAIDNRGRTGGFYLDAGVTPSPDGVAPAGSIHGFVKDRRGRVTTIDVPGVGITLLVGLNDRGDVAGTYLDSTYPGPRGSIHGFIRDRDGSYTTIDVPGAVDTNVTDINNRGDVVGQYTDDDGDVFGYLRDQRGRITTIDPRGPADLQYYLALNDHGQVVGQIDDRVQTPANEPNTRHGFLWERGHLTRFDVPDSTSTGALGINNRGQITGSYTSTNGRQHGFLLQHRRYTTIDAPGRTNTDAWGINDHGDIVIPDPGTGLVPTTT